LNAPAEAKEEPEPSNAGSDSDDEDVPDPHMDVSERKKDMDQEMSKEEKDSLRGGWEEFFPSLWQKRRSPSPSLAERASKRFASNPLSGREGIKVEVEARNAPESTSEAQGRQGTRAASAQQKASPPDEDKVKVTDMGERWACKVCTYNNIVDHGRCGELTERCCIALLIITEMCGARPNGEMPQDIA
jgi:hypothetical protein